MAVSINVLNSSEKRVALDLCLKLMRVNDFEMESWVGQYYGGPSVLETEIINFKQKCGRILYEINFGFKEKAVEDYIKLMENQNIWDTNQIDSMTLTT
ncbi:MAG: hypothetical protein A4S09_15785 [Proteobacteria bacterium SG_bin7]|nr:MAG: hypothetical protein A4S09_15785 [Proteobacteria bacterium SG_bin7]